MGKTTLHSQQKIDAMLSNIPGIVYRGIYTGERMDRFDPDNHFEVEYISDNVEKIFGCPAAMFTETKTIVFDQFMHPEDRDRIRGRIRKQIEKKQSFYIEYRIIDVHRQVKWVFEKGQGFFDDDGALLWIDGVVFDITEQKKTKTALSRSQLRYETLISTVMDWIWETDVAGCFIFANPATRHITGFSPAELLGKSPRDFVAQKEQARRWPLMTKNPQNIYGAFTDLELPFTHQNGTALILEVSGRPFFNEEGIFKGYCGVGRDITRRKDAEADTLKQEKLQGALEMAGAVSHEMNQPLAAIQLFINFAIEECDPKAIIYKDLVKIRKNAMRIGEITMKLMNITSYITKEYVDGQRIIDIEKSAGFES